MTSKYTDFKILEGVGGCEGPGVILAADLPRTKLYLYCKGNSI